MKDLRISRKNLRIGSSHGRNPNLSLFLICLAVAQFILQTGQLTAGTEFIVSHLTNDDTYYYLQTAWNTKQIGFVTFDGFHATNGVQLAWFGIVLLLAMLAQTKSVLLFATLTTSFLLNVLSYFAIWKIAETLKRPVLSLFMASLWLAVSFSGTYSTGLENSLHAFVFWWVVWQVVIFLIRVQKKDPPNFLGLTIALIINAWTRLDAAIFSAVLYICCIAILRFSYQDFKSFFRRSATFIAISGILVSFGIVTQLGAFWLMGRSLLPVSALIKTSGADWGLGADSPIQLAEALIFSIPHFLPDRFPLLASGLFGIVSLLLLIGLLSIESHSYRIEQVAFRQLWFSLFVSMLAYHAIVVVYGIPYPRYFVWYRSPLFIFWIITLSLIAAIIQDFLASKNTKYVPRMLAVTSLLITSIYGLRFAVNINRNLHSTNFHAMRYRAALWISENLPSDAIYAAWNAGELGYFSDRPFINLDGLINSIDYYEHVLQNPAELEALTDYLSENDVNYVVDYVDNELTSALPVVKAFPNHEASGQQIRIWRVLPEPKQFEASTMDPQNHPELT